MRVGTWLLAVALLSAGCAVGGDRPPTRTHAWPFFSESVGMDGTVRSRALGPLYERQDGPDGFVQRTVRPFYSYTESPARAEEDRLLFYPIGRWRERNTEGWAGRRERVQPRRCFQRPKPPHKEAGPFSPTCISASGVQS